MKLQALRLARREACRCSCAASRSAWRTWSREFKSVAGGKLVDREATTRKPDGEDEDAAQLDGIEPQQLFSGEQFYLGLAVSQLDRKQAIPAISPQRERLLEYDLVRAIARVGIGRAAGDRPDERAAGAGRALQPDDAPELRALGARQRAQARLQRQGRVRCSPSRSTPTIKVLLVIHPRDLPEATEYALDQFVLRGGKLIAFVDPYAYFDQQPGPMPGMGGGGTSSTLPTLFKAWGVEMNPGKVLADVVFASGAGQRYTPTVLTLNRTAFSRDDVVTSQIETLLYAFGGAFDVKPVERTEGRRAREELAQLDAGGQHRRDRLGRRGDQGLPARRQVLAARAAADRANSRPRSRTEGRPQVRRQESRARQGGSRR